MTLEEVGKVDPSSYSDGSINFEKLEVCLFFLLRKASASFLTRSVGYKGLMAPIDNSFRETWI